MRTILAYEAASVHWALAIGVQRPPPPTYGGGSGAAPIGSLPEPGGTGGIDGTGGVGGELGSRGACDNASDIDAIDVAGGGLRDVARDCGLPSASSFCASLIGSGSYEECISNCVEESIPGLSTECAACYGGLERCGFQSLCRTQCRLNGCSTTCLDCLNRGGCIEEYERCRGLPGNGCLD